MASAGGLVTVDEARAAALLLSGPAAGVVGAARIALLAGVENALAFDMGGTSTDVCAIVGGEAERSPERLVGGLPIPLPAVHGHTGRAGGGPSVRRAPGGGLGGGPQRRGRRP